SVALHGSDARPQLEVFALHEPPLSRPSATLSPLCGERAGRGVPIWFMVPMHAEKRKGALHEPHPSPLPSPHPMGRGWPEVGVVHGPNACAKSERRLSMNIGKTSNIESSIPAEI